MSVDLQKLFEMQDVLDERIVKEKGLEGQDLLDKKFVALHTELGELMNEYRGFKFWSENRRANTFYPCSRCGGGGHDFINNCGICHGTGKGGNPLLEEFVDSLHFVLSIGNDLGATQEDYSVPEIAEPTIEAQHLNLIREISALHHLMKYGRTKPLDTYRIVFMMFVNLGGLLGFTWDQIEHAYYSKNEVNHARQENGY